MRCDDLFGQLVAVLLQTAGGMWMLSYGRQTAGAETRIQRIENREGDGAGGKKNLPEKVKCLLALYRIIRLPIVKVAFIVGLLNLCRMEKNGSVPV